jgi:hypothetical protein
VTEAIVYQRRLHTVAEIFFAAEARSVQADLLEFIQAPRPVSRARCVDFYTLLLDLREHQEVLWQAMPKSTRYKVHRAAERDVIVYQGFSRTDVAALARFLSFYERFARGKGLPALDPAHLEAQAEARVLELSMANHPDGRELLWHAYYRGDHRVRLLHSASLLPSTSDPAFRNLVGRANRYHHWQDVLHFQAQGLSLYDFGGWYRGSVDREKLGINAFKEGFGGRIVRDFNCTLANSPKGAAVLRARRLRTLGRRVFQSATIRSAGSEVQT